MLQSTSMKNLSLLKLSILTAGILVGAIAVLTINQVKADTSICDAQGNCNVTTQEMQPGPEGIKVDEPQPTQVESTPAPTNVPVTPVNAPVQSNEGGSSPVEPCK